MVKKFSGKLNKSNKKTIIIVIIIIVVILLALAFLFLKKKSVSLEFGETPDYGAGFKPAEKAAEATDVNVFDVKTNPFEEGG